MKVYFYCLCRASHMQDLWHHILPCVCWGWGWGVQGALCLWFIWGCSTFIYSRVYISAHSLTSCHQLRSVFEPFCRPEGGRPTFNVPISGFGKKRGGGGLFDTATIRPLTHTVRVKFCSQALLWQTLRLICREKRLPPNFSPFGRKSDVMVESAGSWSLTSLKLALKTTESDWRCGWSTKPVCLLVIRTRSCHLCESKRGEIALKKKKSGNLLKKKSRLCRGDTIGCGLCFRLQLNSLSFVFINCDVQRNARPQHSDNET